MSYGQGSLSFRTLTAANAQRQVDVVKFDHKDWKLSAWSNACLGELGEAANIIKKIERGDFPLSEVKAKLADEIADVYTYLDILAYEAGIDPTDAIISKWNRISEREGCRIFIGNDDDWHYREKLP